MRHLSLLACLSVSAACWAIGPGDFASAGAVHNDGGNADFLAAVSALNATYGAPGGPTAGPTFTNAPGISVGPGMGARLWFVSQDAAYHNSLGVTIGGVQKVAFADSKLQTGGNFVDLNGGGAIGGNVSFFALANVVGGTAAHEWFDGSGTNADHLNHLTINIVPYVNAGSLWYAIALDDQFGKWRDADWNDMKLVLQVHPISVPEPAAIALSLGFLAVAAWLWRRRQPTLA